MTRLNSQFPPRGALVSNLLSAMAAASYNPYGASSSTDYPPYQQQQQQSVQPPQYQQPVQQQFQQPIPPQQQPLAHYSTHQDLLNCPEDSFEDRTPYGIARAQVIRSYSVHEYF